MLGRAGVTRADVAIAAGLVMAAAGEAVILQWQTPGLLALRIAGAPLLAVLVMRRTRPAVPICVIAAFAVLGTAIQAVFWPHADNSGGVWMFALMFAAFSLGAYGRGRLVALGGLLPLLLGLAIDLPTMSGWAMVSGVIFLTAFIGVLPTAVGGIIRVRRERLATLKRQRDLIVRDQHAWREAAVLTERLLTSERIQPVLLDGLRTLADQAETGAGPGQIEQAARELLGRTRAEVVALTQRVDLPAPALPPPADHLRPVRTVAQPWAVIGAGAIGTGLALESAEALPLSVPVGVAVLASLVVGLPLAAAWRHPLAAVAAAWCAAIAFSRLVAPLDGVLSGTAFSLAVAFTVAALSTRRMAVAGLVVCWLGQLVGVGTDDPLGEAVIILVCWLGGLAVNEVSKLVEQSRTNNRLLAGHEVQARQLAVVEERLRLAREVHDQIGHSLTVVVLQAEVARRMSVTNPDRVQEVMATVAAAARDGLAAMHGEAVADLDALLRRTRTAGLNVSAEVADLDAPGLLDTQERALAYRIVQEALTNVLRHAPGAHTTVVIRQEGRGVAIGVRNGAPAGPGSASGSGQGLIGLYERVAASAGELRWGPREDGGFEVRALLPTLRLQGADR